MWLFTGKVGQSIREPPLLTDGDWLQPWNSPCEAKEPSPRQSTESYLIRSKAELLHEATDRAHVSSVGFKTLILCSPSPKLGCVSAPCCHQQCPCPCSPLHPAKLSHLPNLTLLARIFSPRGRHRAPPGRLCLLSLPRAPPGPVTLFFNGTLP